MKLDALRVACVSLVGVFFGAMAILATLPAPDVRRTDVETFVAEPHAAAEPLRAVPVDPELAKVTSYLDSITLGTTDGASCQAYFAPSEVCPVCSKTLSGGPSFEGVVLVEDRHHEPVFRGCYDCLIARLKGAGR